jgi:uncharacterized protein
MMVARSQRDRLAFGSAPCRFVSAAAGNAASDMRDVEPSPAWIAPKPPVPVPRPMLLQEWQHCSFLHWSFEPAVLRPRVPPNLDLDIHDGRAWVSLISFAIPTMRPGRLPPIPGLRSGAESHLRTYVIDVLGRRGIWMVSVDIDPLLAAVGGRFPFLLPYWWASISIDRGEGSVRCTAIRRVIGGGRLDVDLAIGRRLPRRELSELDDFLTARWMLYAGIPSVLTAITTDHPPWVLRRTTVGRLEQTVTRAAGLPDPDAPPIAHFSDGVTARLSPPRRVPVLGTALAQLPAHP